MTVPATTGWQPFNIEQSWIYPYVTGAPGTGIVIPGIVQATGSPQNTVVEHRGDGTVIAKVATFDSIDLTVTVADWDTVSILSMTGGVVSAGGTGADEWRKIVHKSNDAAADCAIAVQTHSRGPDGGGTRLVWPRCQPQNIPTYGLNDQEFQDLDIPMSAVATSTLDMVYMYHFETYTAMTSTYATTAP